MSSSSLSVSGFTSSSLGASAVSSSSSLSAADDCLDGVRRIELRAETQKVYVLNKNDAFRLRITATRACRMPVAIFRYLVYDYTDDEGLPVSTFTHVCSCGELELLPIDTPAAGAIPPQYRASSIDLLFSTPAAALDAQQTIFQEVDLLRESLDAADALEELDTSWLGGPPA